MIVIVLVYKVEYDRTDISEGIKINQGSDSNECKVFHYWYFFKNVAYQSFVCNGCCDVTQKSMSSKDITIVKV